MKTVSAQTIKSSEGQMPKESGTFRQIANKLLISTVFGASVLFGRLEAKPDYMGTGTVQAYIGHVRSQTDTTRLTDTFVASIAVSKNASVDLTAKTYYDDIAKQVLTAVEKTDIVIDAKKALTDLKGGDSLVIGKETWTVVSANAQDIVLKLSKNGGSITKTLTNGAALGADSSEAGYKVAFGTNEIHIYNTTAVILSAGQTLPPLPKTLMPGKAGYDFIVNDPNSFTANLKVMGRTTFEIARSDTAGAIVDTVTIPVIKFTIASGPDLFSRGRYYKAGYFFPEGKTMIAMPDSLNGQPNSVYLATTSGCAFGPNGASTALGTIEIQAGGVRADSVPWVANMAKTVNTGLNVKLSSDSTHHNFGSKIVHIGLDKGNFQTFNDQLIDAKGNSYQVIDSSNVTITFRGAPSTVQLSAIADTMYVPPTTGVNEQDMFAPDPFSIYPNPAMNGTAILELAKATKKPTTIFLYNEAGQQVALAPLPAFQDKMEIGNLFPGIYFIRVDGTTRKLIVK